jgi:ATP-dependent Clp protease adaptor protein ClpS
MADPKIKPGDSTVLEPREKTKRPRLYRVLLHNDNYTTMEFVVEVLQDVFAKSLEDAVGIMLSVHQEGLGVAGTYPLAVAESKVSAVQSLAEANGYPLKSSMEPE